MLFVCALCSRRNTDKSPRGDRVNCLRNQCDSPCACVEKKKSLASEICNYSLESKAKTLFLVTKIESVQALLDSQKKILRSIHAHSFLRRIHIKNRYSNGKNDFMIERNTQQVIGTGGRSHITVK